MSGNFKKSDSVSGGLKKKIIIVCLFLLAVVLIILIVRMQLGKNHSEVLSEIVPSQTYSQNTSSVPTEISDSAASTNTAATQRGTTSSSSKADLQLVHITSKVSPGGEASITIQGQANTTYSIHIHYSTVVKKAVNLKDQTSDSQGIVSWTWKVDSGIKDGTCQIEIVGADQVIPADITIQ